MRSWESWSAQEAWQAAARLAPRLATQAVALPDGTRVVVDRWPRLSSGSPAAPGVLLVHGLASNARLWDAVAACLSEAGRAVAAVDLRGHGRSDKPDRGYGTEEVAEDVAAVLGALAREDPGVWSQAVVVGQSWGGNVAVELAWRHPELVRGVVAVDGGVIDLQERFEDAEACFAALAPPDLVGRPRGEVAEALRRGHPDWPEGGRLAVLANFEIRPDGTVAPWLSRDRHLAVLAGLYRHRPLERIRALTVPLVLLMADDGTASVWARDKRAAVERAVREGRDVEVCWCSPGDHDLHVQQPVPVAQIIEGLLERVAAEEPAATGGRTGRPPARERAAAQRAQGGRAQGERDGDR